MLISYAAATAAKLLQLCPTLCDPIDGSPPGSADPGIFQARILEWVAIAFSMMTSITAHQASLSITNSQSSLQGSKG